MMNRVTVNIKIPHDNTILETIEIYRKGLQFCIDTAWEKRIRNNIRLHPFVYMELRRCGLKSQLAVACIKHACGMVKRAKNKPIVKTHSMRYNHPRSFSFRNGILNILTIEGRKKFNVKVPKYAEKYIGWKIRESIVWSGKKNRTFFGLCLSKDTDIRSDQHRRVIGIDVGIKHLAVTSDAKFYGSVVPRMVGHQRNVFGLQRKGTKSAKRHLKRLSGRWKRFMRSENHRISRKIVSGLRDGDIVAMEEIRNIRKNKGRRLNRQLHSWAFRQLQSFVEYKALQRGCPVVYVDPAYTSKTCRLCGKIGTRNRGFFACDGCEYSCNADLNASFNIKNKVEPLATTFGLSVNQPIVASYEGLLNAKHFESSELSYNPTALVVGS